MDGLTGVIQDKLRHGHETTALQMMYGVNFYAPIYLTIGQFTIIMTTPLINTH